MGWTFFAGADKKKSLFRGLGSEAYLTFRIYWAEGCEAVSDSSG